MSSPISIRNPFLDLPAGTKENIISYFHHEDVINSLSLICKQGWSEVVKDENLWQRRAIRQLGEKLSKEWYQSCDSNWKKVCETLSKNGLIYSDGVQEKGNFLNGKLHGQDGLRIYPDASTEDGEFENGELKKGLIRWNDGEEWEGQFKDGLLHGRGSIMIDNDEECSLVEGVFEQGQLVEEYLSLEESFSSEDDEISDQADFE